MSSGCCLTDAFITVPLRLEGQIFFTSLTYNFNIFSYILFQSLVVLVLGFKFVIGQFADNSARAPTGRITMFVPTQVFTSTSMHASGHASG